MASKIMHSKFNHHPSQAYMHAVEALNLLKASEDSLGRGIDTAGRAYSDAVHDDLMQEYMKMHNLKLSRKNHRCLCYLVGNKRCREYTEMGTCITIDCADHCYMFTRNKKPFVFVTQPYNLTVEGMKSIAEVCEQHDLEAIVSTESWHYPAGTLFIEIHHKGWEKDRS